MPYNFDYNGEDDMDIAILGGGVAGVSSAIALKQRGFNVTVYERQHRPATIGAGIVVWPNAAFVLEQLGVLDEITAAAGPVTEMRRLSHSNEYLGAIDIEAINLPMGYTSLAILRSDFQNILIAKLKALGIDIQYGHTVTAIKNQPTSAEVSFQNGLTITADVILGADGRMASLTRQYVQDDNQPIYQGFINWIGVYETTQDSFSEPVVTDYWGIGERFGIVPVTQRKAYWAAGIACQAMGLRNPADYPAELQTVFSTWPEPVQRLIEHTPVERMNKIYVHDHNPVRIWHKQNVIMIGDAAHAALPTSGQGACQALEDAWHLAHYIATHASDLHRAFSEFTALRFAKTTAITQAGRNLAATLFNRDEAVCRARNEASKRTDFSKVATAMAHAWSQGLPLTAQP